jgi:sigma-B regulation protein RsbU (phosphoserine phosphatase)
MSPAPSSGALPLLLVVQGGEESTVPITRSPFTIGRKADRDLVIADPRVSREHAQLVLEGPDIFIHDLGSKHGTFVNGERVERHRLIRNDRIDFGASDAAYAIFSPERSSSTGVREFLSHMPDISKSSGTAGDLEKLKIFLEAARNLNTIGVLDEVLVTLIEATLRLTHAERGYVFLVQPDGSLRLAAGRNARGQMLLDDKTISHSIIEDAVKSASEFVLTDTSKMSNLSARESIVAYDLRTVICIPLRRPKMQQSAAAEVHPSEISGVLYLDSRFASRALTTVSTDILRAIATEAAALVENASLVQAETAARAYQQELAIAASLQQRLMTMTAPEAPFVSARGKNLSCKQIGGDFFDVMQLGNAIAAVVCDVSGKGVSAALMGSILQGMIYSQLTAGLSLEQIAAAANRFLLEKVTGDKYATLVIARLEADGTVDFINCGHIPPLVVSAGGEVRTLDQANVPVGLLSIAQYQSARCTLKPGDRFIVVTDGVTEAENAAGDMFGAERLHAAAACESPFENIFEQVRGFCAGLALNDDCTVLELAYRGSAAEAS